VIESYEVLVLTDEMILIGNMQNDDKNPFLRIQVLGADKVAKWMKQHLNIKKLYGQSEQTVHNRMYIAVIVYFFNTTSYKLQISRHLKAVLWKWARNLPRKNKRKYGSIRIENGPLPQSKFKIKKLGVNYFCLTVSDFLKTQNSIIVHATLKSMLLFSNTKIV